MNSMSEPTESVSSPLTLSTSTSLVSDFSELAADASYHNDPMPTSLPHRPRPVQSASRSDYSRSREPSDSLSAASSKKHQLGHLRKVKPNDLTKDQVKAFLQARSSSSSPDHSLETIEQRARKFVELESFGVFAETEKAKSTTSEGNELAFEALLTEAQEKGVFGGIPRNRIQHFGSTAIPSKIYQKPDGRHNCKPDFTSVPLDKATEDVYWRDVRAVLELKKNTKHLNEQLLADVSAKVLDACIDYPSRSFCPALLVSAKDFCFTIHDRCTTYRTSALRLQEDAELFIQILEYLRNSSPEKLGFPKPESEEFPDGAKRLTSAKPHQLDSRCTIVARSDDKKDEQYPIIKSYWPTYPYRREGEVLEQLNRLEVAGVPKIKSVPQDAELTCTCLTLGEKHTEPSGGERPCRVLRTLHLSDCGNPLSSSVPEQTKNRLHWFAQRLDDAQGIIINAWDSGYHHNDIHPGNLCVRLNGDVSVVSVIDWEFASRANATVEQPGTHTGVARYKSTDLINNQIRSKPSVLYDAESLVWIFASLVLSDAIESKKLSPETNEYLNRLNDQLSNPETNMIIAARRELVTTVDGFDPVRKVYAEEFRLLRRWLYTVLKARDQQTATGWAKGFQNEVSDLIEEYTDWRRKVQDLADEKCWWLVCQLQAGREIKGM